MKRFARMLCLILAVVMIFAVPVKAAEDASTWSSSYFMRSSVYLYETSATTFEAWFDVTAMRTMDIIGASVIKIQRSSDNENWTTMKTYYMEDYTNLVREDNVTHAAGVTYTGTKGYYYRAFIKLYAKDDTGSAVWSRYTSSLYLD